MNLVMSFKDTPENVDRYIKENTKAAFSGAGNFTQPASSPLISAASDDSIVSLSDKNVKPEATAKIEYLGKSWVEYEKILL